MVVNRGGRQGCRFGGDVFSLGYAVALGKVSEKLKAEGIALSLKFSNSSPLFCSDPVSNASDVVDVVVVDVTFIDDEAIIVTAKSPDILDAHIAKVVEIVYCVFRDHFMTVNFKKGKTEAMMMYRGKNAAACKRKLADSADGEGNFHKNISFVYSADIVNIKLCIVDQYKHLGSTVAKDGGLVPEARMRATSAMCAYAPIAQSVFGAKSIEPFFRVQLAYSVVVSRLVYNVHIWSSIPNTSWRIFTSWR